MPESARAGKAPVVLAAVCAALLVAQHVAARACRDALFLSSFSAAELPKVMLGAAAVGLPAVLMTSRAMGRFGPGRVIPVLLMVSGALHAFEWSLLGRAPDLAVIILYLHASIATGIAISGFWSIVNEGFNPHVVRRVAGQLSGGSAAGGLVGGLFARFFGIAEGPAAMLPVLAGMSLVGALALRALARSTHGSTAAGADATDVRSVTGSSYLKSIALLVVLTGLSSALVDFAFKTRVSGEMSSGSALVGFFALFYTATSLASVVMQLTVARWVLADLGLGLTLAALPGAVVGLGLLGVALPKAWVLVLLRGAGSAFETSLFRSAYEPLYAPLPLAQKRSAKTLIDVACDRLGEALGSGWVLAIGSVLPALASRVGLVTAVVVSGICVWLSIRLERGYVTELASSLRSGKLRLDAHEVNDATTRLTLSQTQLEIDRDALLKQIEELRRRAPGAARPGSLSADAPSPPVAATLPPLRPSLAQRLGELQSMDPERVLAALGGRALEPELVSLVIPLLEHPATAEAASAALREVGPGIVGQLVDALLDPERTLRLRRRIPRLLRAHPNRRAVDGLMDALASPEFELRYRSALALRDLVRQDPSLVPARNLVLAAAGREVEASKAAWHARSASDAAQDDGAESASSGRAVLPDRALDHVFTLLGLAFDADSIELSRRALSTGDEKLRGTALEYLEHVVPEPIRAGIWPYLQAGRLPRQAQGRSPSEIVAELKRSFG